MIELNGENYLNGHEASHLLGVKISTLYTYVSRGVLRSYKQGIKRQRLYKQAELESLLQLRSSDELVSSSEGLEERHRVELPRVEDWMSNA
ncbi:MAG TPA: helix-turn-helix domain-containing protein [Ktedonobacteraceae bacterium]|jgi:excisionase family DNA binding protein